MAGIPATLAKLVVPIETLTPYPRNPRRGDVDAIARSLEAHGQYRPLVVNEPTREVLAGNHTLAAAVSLGWEEIAVTFVDVDEDAAARIVLIDNRTNDLASWDDSSLSDLLASLDSLDGTGFEDSDLAALLSSYSENGDEAEADEGEERVRYSFSVFSRDDVIEEAFAHFRTVGFPYRVLPRLDCLIEINALAAMETDALVRTDTGYGVADTFHPHRWHAHVSGMRNAIDTFEDDRGLRKTIEHTLNYGLGFTPATFAHVLGLTNGAQHVSNFRPGFALHFLRRYSPPGATVLDCSTGYGGRLVAFLASDAERYVGFDPASETHAGNQALALALTPDGKSVELHCLPAEDVDHDLVRGRADFAFTSPPYFAKERYSDEETQSWKRYPSPEEWRDGFLRPLLALQFVALKSGAANVLNIADVKIARTSELVPLVEWTLSLAREVGFDVEDVERYTLTRRWGRNQGYVASEPVIVMRKP